MQFLDVWCYAILIITVTSCVQADEHKQELSVSAADKRIAKRDAAIFIDSFPIEPIYKHRPQIIYRRISKPTYNPRPKYGPPRNKYRSKHSRSPSKKYKKTVGHKYGPPKYKKYPPKYPQKPRYGPPKSSHRPVYGPPRKKPHRPHYPAEPAGFGEPPQDFLPDYHPPKASYGEPPQDSYGTPIKLNSADLYPPLSDYLETTSNYDNQDYNLGQEYKSWQSFQNDHDVDNTYAYSKKRPTYVKPEPEEVFDAITAPDEDFNLNSYSDVYKFRKYLKEQNFKENDYDRTPNERFRKPSHFGEGPKKSRIFKESRATPDYDSDQIIVGGQYAEPPGRYMPKFQPSAPMYTGDEGFSPSNPFEDSEVAASATISPYVNYKNGNIAFSPQNLNDAFSIIDK